MLGHWPTRNKICDEQRQSKVSLAATAVDENSLLQVNDKMRIPEEADYLKLELVAVVPDGSAGNLGGEAMAATLRKELTWNVLTTHAKDFISNCLLYLLFQSGAKVLRPLATILRSKKPKRFMKI